MKHEAYHLPRRSRRSKENLSISTSSQSEWRIYDGLKLIAHFVELRQRFVGGICGNWFSFHVRFPVSLSAILWFIADKYFDTRFTSYWCKISNHKWSTLEILSVSLKLLRELAPKILRFYIGIVTLNICLWLFLGIVFGDYLRQNVETMYLK